MDCIILCVICFRSGASFRPSVVEKFPVFSLRFQSSFFSAIRLHAFLSSLNACSFKRLATGPLNVRHSDVPLGPTLAVFPMWTGLRLVEQLLERYDRYDRFSLLSDEAVALFRDEECVRVEIIDFGEASRTLLSLFLVVRRTVGLVFPRQINSWC